MSLKNIKLPIAEIPKEWTSRLRSGHTNIWNQGSTDPDRPETSLIPPIRGLYAERFDDGWYWVCGCHTCLENGKPYSYIVCDEHNRCITCGTHRNNLTEAPWGTAEGFQCKPCANAEHQHQKEEALANARRLGHSETDCAGRDTIICPKCGSETEPDDGDPPYEIDCHVCDTPFLVEAEYEIVPVYTTRLLKNKEDDQ